MKKFLENVILYPICFALSPLLALYFVNMDAFPVRVLVAPFLIVGVLTMLFWGVLCWIVKDAHKAALLVIISTVLAFTSMLWRIPLSWALVILKVIPAAQVEAFPYTRQGYWIWASALLIMWAIPFYWIRKPSFEAQKLTRDSRRHPISLALGRGIDPGDLRRIRVLEARIRWLRDRALAGGN